MPGWSAPMRKCILLCLLLPLSLGLQAQDLALPGSAENIPGEPQEIHQALPVETSATAVIINETENVSDTIEEVYARGLALLKAGDALSASRLLGEVLAARPLEGKAHTNLARALLALDDVKDASFHAVKGVLYGPDSSAWNVLGLVHLAHGKKISAKEAFDKAIAIFEGNAWAHNNLGWLHYRSGRIELAEKYLRRAAELSPRTAIFQKNLAYVLESVGKHEEARKAWRLARELEPGAGKESRIPEPSKNVQFN